QGGGMAWRCEGGGGGGGRGRAGGARHGSQITPLSVRSKPAPQVWVTIRTGGVTYRRRVIEPQAPAPPRSAAPGGGPCGSGGGPGGGPPPLPVRQGTGRFLVLAGVFVCAACGLVYELELLALATYLMGDSVTHASVVLSVMVFAMGIGSLAAKRLRGNAAAGFGAVEAALALIGGCSAMALSAVYAFIGDWGGAWVNGPRWLLVAFSLATGLLIGAEVPLLMEL